MKHCTNCGAQLDDHVQFCNQCGAPQAAPAPQYAPPAGGYTPNNGYAPNGGYTAAIPRTPVKTDYSLLMYILLTMVTCGIYGYYMIYKLASDVNQICAEDGDKVGGLGTYILLSIVTCGFYSFYWLYKIQNRLHANGPRYNVPVAENGTTVLMWLIFGSLLCGIGSFVIYAAKFTLRKNSRRNQLLCKSLL
jgi:hypothetical protein